MLKIKSDVDMEKLVELGFVSFKASRETTYYYFLCRNSGCGEMLLCNNVTRDIQCVKREAGDSRTHCYPKYQKRGMHIEDGLYRIITAGLVESSEEINK